MIYVPLALVAVLSAAAAYAITAKPATSVVSKKLDLQAGMEIQPATGMNVKKAFAASDGRKRNAKSIADDDPVLIPSELRDAFRKRLADADLLKRFDLKLEDQSWSMQAALDDDEATRFARILAAFVKTHHITFPVHANVGSAELMLPFKIRQVISGANASVVTQDGNRLYVGDEYQGVRLAAIQDNHLTFSGKRKIEVNW